MLRDGPWLEQPCRIDRTTVRRPTPDAFKSKIADPTIGVLPLVKDEKAEHGPGWCHYVDGFDSPEMEVISGGVNHKTPTAAAVWRQGHLLHFGFDLSPDEMNDRGRDLLVNCVAYIARFPEDRPIPHTPDRALLRASTDRIMAKKEPDKGYVEWLFSPVVRAKGHADDWPAFQDWYRKHRDFLRADAAAKGALVLDEDAQALGVPPNQPAFFPAALEALKAGGDRAARATRLLRRYAPDGPAEADLAAWQRWWSDNEPYEFFSEAGWYRWYTDPLARKRGIPTAKLRGAARASR